MALLASLVDYNNPASLGSAIRARRSCFLRELIETIHAKKGSVRIVDLGGTLGYWKIFLPDYLQHHGVTVTLVNTMTSKEQRSGFTSVVGDACDVDYADGSFDLVHSNSTIEHLGSWERMAAFANEVRRLGPYYFVQTPYFWFPVEPHDVMAFAHWLPQGMRAKLMLRFSGRHARPRTLHEAMMIVQDATMLDRAQMRHLFPEARLQFEWFGPFPKSILAIHS